MYDIADENCKRVYSEIMKLMKYENMQYKELLASKPYKIGSRFVDLMSSLTSISRFKKNLKALEYGLRWKKVVRKYPVTKENTEQGCKEQSYFSKKKFVVYTCIFGKYDLPQEPLFVPDNCEFRIITDQPIPKKTKWLKYDVNELIPDYQKLSDVEKNRFCKMLPFIIFQDVDYSIYIDGNITVITDLTEMINSINQQYGMAFHIHKARKCVYDELEACYILKKAPLAALNTLKEHMLKIGFPHNYGMLECNVIVRDHKNEVMKKIMKQWWDDFYFTDVKRDQLLLPIILWNNELAVKELGLLGKNVEYNDSIRVCRHL